MRKINAGETLTTISALGFSFLLGWQANNLINKGEELSALEKNVELSKTETSSESGSQKDIFISKLLQGVMNNKESTINVLAENLNGKNWKIPISTNQYFEYKLKKHYITKYEELTDFVTYKDSIVNLVANFVTQGQDKETSAQTLLDFVHRFVYDNVHEKKSYDYVKYPIETMCERGGDCEDLAILGASLMKARGLDVALIHILKDESKEINVGHVAIGVVGNFEGYYREFEGKKYYFAEATGTEASIYPIQLKIGFVAPEYIAADFIFYKIE